MQGQNPNYWPYGQSQLPETEQRHRTMQARMVIPTARQSDYHSPWATSPHLQPAPQPSIAYEVSFPGMVDPYQQPNLQASQQYYQNQPIQQPPLQGYYQPGISLAQIYQPSHQSSTGYLPQQPNRQQQPRPQHQPAPPQNAVPLAAHHQSPITPSSRPKPQTQQVSRNPHPYSMAPTPQQRTVTHVQIPVQQTPSASRHQDVPRPVKKRRSNDGAAVGLPLSTEQQKPPRGTPNHVKQCQPESSPLTELASSQLSEPPMPVVDYQATLLSLADEYVSAAYSMSSAVASSGFHELDVEEYHHLIATALGCLQSYLKNFKPSDPRKEARVRLRLAQLLHEETESFEIAEEVLSKGIALCERNRLTDLKYAMHHLLVRVYAKRNLKSAIFAIEKLVKETTDLDLPIWVYTFKFLRVSLCWHNHAPGDTTTSLKNIAAIQTMADGLRHPAVQIMATAFETAIHLRSGADDAVEMAQRSLASARMHQLSPEMQQLPQMRAVLDCLDLACSLMQFRPGHILEKMQHMHANMDSATRDKAWTKNSGFVVPLGLSASDTAGVIARTDQGEAALSFEWIHKGQLYALGYLLSGVASSYQNSGDTKSEKFLDEALKLVELQPDKIVQPLPTVIDRSHWQITMETTIRLQLICAQCARSDWVSAREALEKLQVANSASLAEMDDFTTALMIYMDAVCRQANGELKVAYALLAAKELDYFNVSKEETALRDLSLVAGLNRVLCLRGLGRSIEADDLVEQIEEACLVHHHKAVPAAHHVLRATTQSSTTAIIKIKQNLQFAVQAAKLANNNQLLCIVMSLMTQLFFSNIVGEQAVKSARASRTLANKTQNVLWRAVADRMYGNTLELSGEINEARKARIEAIRAMESLPPAIKLAFAG
ncbi:hypothetical protein LTR86_000585 [Recurvomyces mirabilis]|nr:hypothetical protein LTR86_000585 [Recurvomyces mirabilis]